MNKTVKIVVAVIFYVGVLFVAQKLWALDVKDRTHPYGLDDTKKKLSNISGEKNGVSLYWGKPNKTDKILDSLNKVEWLSDSYVREVKWRRALFFSLILSVLILFVTDIRVLLDVTKFFPCVIIISVFLYGSHQYYDHHVNHHRSQYVKSHIRFLKKSLKLPKNNPIYNVL